MLTITVSQLNRYVKAVLEEDPRLRDVYIKGEIAGLVRHRTSGHCYFKLADEGGSVKVVMFSRHAGLLEFEPTEGMAVLARASVGVYERDGAYQLYVTEMMPDGAGALAVALAQRKERLTAQGVFDPTKKKPLPAFPHKIGVVTSKSGAALQDIRTVVERRWPLCTLVLCSAQVQGKDAPASLKKALKALDSVDCDVILLARGGGSAEELWSFNDEELVLTVHRCQTPVISAVGHETDYTLCDYAADARAPTPSAAAELAVPDRQEQLRRIRGLEENLRQMANNQLATRRQILERMASHPALKSPGAMVDRCKEKVDIYHKALYNSKRLLIRRLENRLTAGAGLLDSLSPLRVLDRGYCLALRKDAPVTRAKILKVGDKLELRFSDGSAMAAVTKAAGEENP